MSRIRRSLLPLLALCACAHIQTQAALTTQAASFFTRADSDENAGSLVVDLDELRALGFLNPAPAGQHTVISDIVAYTLPTVAGELKDRPEGALIARAAVLFALFREWDGWPRVQRVGMIAPDAGEDHIVALAALDGNAQVSHDLLAALSSADRAAGSPALTPLDGKLCLAPDREKRQWCITSGDGFLAVGTPEGLEQLPALLNGPTKATVPAIARIRLNLPEFGKGYIAIEPNNGVRLRGAFASPKDDVALMVEDKLRDVLGQLEKRHEAQQSMIGPVLERTQKGLEADPSAPTSLKSAAARLSVEGLLDPEGTWSAIRKSIHVARNGNVVTAEALLPEAAVRRAAEGGTSFVTFASVGALSAIAIPAFVKFQCESKQSEASELLSQAREGVAFTAPANSRYSYCRGETCIPCSAEGCYMPPPEANPCIRLLKSEMKQKYRFLQCAVGDLTGSRADSTLDVWVVTEDGAPRHLQDGCG